MYQRSYVAVDSLDAGPVAYNMERRSCSETRSCSDNPARLTLAVDHSCYNAANSPLNHMQVVAGGWYAGPTPEQQG